MPNDRGQGLLTADGRQPVVAVIDSNRSTSAVAAMLAEQFGCHALPMRSVDAALKLLKRDEAVDLALIDFGVSDMDPIAAAQQIRTLDLRGALPLIAIDSRSPAAGRSGERGLFAGTVTKPYSPRELFAAIEKSLGRIAETAAAP